MGEDRKTRTQSQWLYHLLCILSMIEDEMQQAGEKNLGLQLSGLFMCCCRKPLDLLISLMLPSLHYSSSIFLTQPPQVVVSWCK